MTSKVTSDIGLLETGTLRDVTVRSHQQDTLSTAEAIFLLSIAQRARLNGGKIKDTLTKLYRQSHE